MNPRLVEGEQPAWCARSWRTGTVSFALLREHGPVGGHPLFVIQQVGVETFATHYLDASLGVTLVARDEQSSFTYLAYVNRSHVDMLQDSGAAWREASSSPGSGRTGRACCERRPSASRGDAPAIPFWHHEAQP